MRNFEWCKNCKGRIVTGDDDLCDPCRDPEELPKVSISETGCVEIVLVLLALGLIAAIVLFK